MGTVAKLQRNVAIISAASTIARYSVTSGVFLATGAAMRSTAWLAGRITLSIQARNGKAGNCKLQLFIKAEAEPGFASKWRRCMLQRLQSMYAPQNAGQHLLSHTLLNPLPDCYQSLEPIPIAQSL